MREMRAIVYVPAGARNADKVRQELVQQALSLNQDFTVDDIGFADSPVQVWSAQAAYAGLKVYCRPRHKPDLAPPSVIALEPPARRRSVGAILIPAPFVGLLGWLRRHPARAAAGAAGVAGVVAATMLMALRDDQGGRGRPSVAPPRPGVSPSVGVTASASTSPALPSPTGQPPPASRAPVPASQEPPQESGSGAGQPGESPTRPASPATSTPAVPSVPPASAAPSPPQTGPPSPTRAAKPSPWCFLRLDSVGVTVKVCLG